jgi:hypothetical protein
MNITALFLPFSMIFSLLTDTYIGENYLVLYNLRGSQNSTDNVDDFYYSIYDDDYNDGDSDIVI